MHPHDSASQRDLLALLYHPNLPPWQVGEAYAEWGQQFPHTRKPRRRAPSSPIRLGYLSGNFCSNPEVLFTLPLFRNHAREAFQIFAYSNVARPDSVTHRFQALADQWRDISRLDDTQAASLIRQDRLDILVDLSGHWESGRLSVLALRPAPTQVSFPTFPATSGLTSVDFRITDGDADPPGLTESQHSESLIRLPRCYCCYELPKRLPRLTPLPYRKNRCITFGSFHRFQKLSGELFRLWSAVLHRVPQSRLLFHHVFGGERHVSGQYRQPILDAFRRLGIARSRILFAGNRPQHEEHLETIARADIALDAFPYHGMTITCDCFTMGIPVVTYAGLSHVSRVGVSLLKSLNLDDWIASTPEQYIEIAVAAAQDLPTLSRLRANLRPRLRNSPLTDARGYTMAVEAAYRQMVSVPSKD